MRHGERRTIVFLGVGVAMVAIALTACGGGSSDDLSDIRQTATAAAQRTPAPASPTTDAAEAYRARATTLGGELVALLQSLHDDLIAAQATQADPKWPGVLTTDTDLVSAKAKELSALPRPGTISSTLTSGLKGTADSCASAAESLKAAVKDADAERAAQAVAALEQASASLGELLPQLQSSAASPTP